MREFISKTFIFLGIFSIVMGSFASLGTNISFAEDLELIGGNIGLEIIPASTRLFDLDILNPGDTKEAKIDIKNNYSQAFSLSMRAERTSSQPDEGEVDIYEQLILTVSLGDELIYTGPMEGFDDSHIDLGRFNPGALQELKAVIHLPGPETGNEYQGKGVEVKWIFEAKADQPPSGPDPEPDPDPDDDTEIEVEDEVDIPEEEDDTVIEVEDEVDIDTLPKTGSKSSFMFTVLGVFLLMIGLVIMKKKDEKN